MDTPFLNLIHMLFTIWTLYTAANLKDFGLVGWLVVLRIFGDISAISRLGT